MCTKIEVYCFQEHLPARNAGKVGDEVSKANAKSAMELLLAGLPGGRGRGRPDL